MKIMSTSMALDAPPSELVARGDAWQPPRALCSAFSTRHSISDVDKDISSKSSYKLGSNSNTDAGQLLHGKALS